MIRWTDVVDRALQPRRVADTGLFRARAGWCRTFGSELDCRMYERGYARFPQVMEAGLTVSPPYRNGWFDAEHDESVRREAAASGFSDTKDDRGFY